MRCSQSHMEIYGMKNKSTMTFQLLNWIKLYRSSSWSLLLTFENFQFQLDFIYFRLIIISLESPEQWESQVNNSHEIFNYVCTFFSFFILHNLVINLHNVVLVVGCCWLFSTHVVADIFKVSTHHHMHKNYCRNSQYSEKCFSPSNANLHICSLPRLWRLAAFVEQLNWVDSSLPISLSLTFLSSDCSGDHKTFMLLGDRKFNFAERIVVRQRGVAHFIHIWVHLLSHSLKRSTHDKISYKIHSSLISFKHHTQYTPSRVRYDSSKSILFWCVGLFTFSF